MIWPQKLKFSRHFLKLVVLTILPMTASCLAYADEILSPPLKHGWLQAQEFKCFDSIAIDVECSSRIGLFDGALCGDSMDAQIVHSIRSLVEGIPVQVGFMRSYGSLDDADLIPRKLLDRWPTTGGWNTLVIVYRISISTRHDVGAVSMEYESVMRLKGAISIPQKAAYPFLQSNSLPGTEQEIIAGVKALSAELPGILTRSLASCPSEASGHGTK